jgi:hypothetical protein
MYRPVAARNLIGPDQGNLSTGWPIGRGEVGEPEAGTGCYQRLSASAAGWGSAGADGAVGGAGRGAVRRVH